MAKSSELLASSAEGSSEKSTGLEQIRIIGGQRLNGDIRVSGAKNVALKLMCAALLTEDSMHFENMPNSLRDIHSQVELLEYLGCRIACKNDLMAINDLNIRECTAP